MGFYVGGGYGCAAGYIVLFREKALLRMVLFSLCIPRETEPGQADGAVVVALKFAGPAPITN